MTSKVKPLNKRVTGRSKKTIPQKKIRPAKREEKLDWKPGTMIYPLPAVMVSCGETGKSANIITIAWTGIICTDPPMCQIAVRPERYSYGLIKEQKAFCINLTTRPLAFATDWCGVKSGRDVDKFAEMKLNALPCKKIPVPMIEESPINLECKVTEIRPLGTHHLFMAEIVHIRASRKYLDPASGAFDLSKADPICYSHGKYYTLGKEIGKFGFSVKKKRS